MVKADTSAGDIFESVEAEAAGRVEDKSNEAAMAGDDRSALDEAGASKGRLEPSRDEVVAAMAAGDRAATDDSAPADRGLAAEAAVAARSGSVEALEVKRVESIDL